MNPIIKSNIVADLDESLNQPVFTSRVKDMKFNINSLILGGIADSTARKLLRGNHVKHFYIRNTYMIPKVWVIEYVLSEHYAEYREKLKVQV